MSCAQPSPETWWSDRGDLRFHWLQPGPKADAPQRPNLESASDGRRGRPRSEQLRAESCRPAHFTALKNVRPVVSSDQVIAGCPRASATTSTMRAR
jgi:hypothetical protein